MHKYKTNNSKINCTAEKQNKTPQEKKNLNIRGKKTKNQFGKILS